MFERPRYIQNNFSIIFPRVPDIRRKANQFENRLKGEYVQPQIISVPDLLDPQVPRIIFDSKNGFSQIVISQISISLNVSYSPEYQIDSKVRYEYLSARIPTLYKLIDVLRGVKPYFCGLTTLVHLPSDVDERELLNHLTSLFTKDQDIDNLFDLQIKTTRVIEEQFFSNITIDNYRSWSIEDVDSRLNRNPSHETAEKGIRILGDYNDRYAFNEVERYRSSKDSFPHILDMGLESIERVIKQIGGNSYDE